MVFKFWRAPYRSTRVLERLGPRVRRVETLNAYVRAPDGSGPITLYRACGRTNVPEIQINAEVERICSAAGFKAERIIAEIVGICSWCRQDEAQSS